MANWFMKEPCVHCPFRRDVTPFLHPHRAEEIAYLSGNRYNEFTCHKTLEYDDEGEGDLVATRKSLMCAGFLAMQIDYGGRQCPDGFTPSDEVYTDPSEMVDAYDEAWTARRGKRAEA